MFAEHTFGYTGSPEHALFLIVYVLILNVFWSSTSLESQHNLSTSCKVFLHREHIRLICKHLFIRNVSTLVQRVRWMSERTRTTTPPPPSSQPTASMTIIYFTNLDTLTQNSRSALRQTKISQLSQLGPEHGPDMVRTCPNIGFSRTHLSLSWRCTLHRKLDFSFRKSNFSIRNLTFPLGNLCFSYEQLNLSLGNFNSSIRKKTDIFPWFSLRFIWKT